MFSSFAIAHDGIDSNCNDYIVSNRLIKFSNQSKINGTYSSRKKDYEYIKKKGWDVSSYYQNLEGYSLSGDYDQDKYHPLFDTERVYYWDNIKKSYRENIEAVNKEVKKPNYKENFYDRNGNFRSTHTCAEDDACLAYKAYCSEQVAKKGVSDKMRQYMRINDHCNRGAKDIEEYEDFIKTCEDVISNLNYVQKKGNELNDIAKEKTPEAKTFFDEVYHEFSEFKDNWDGLKKDMEEKLAQYRADLEKKKEDELYKKEMELKNAALDPVRDEFFKCANLSDARDKDIKGRNLADGICQRLGDPVSPMSMTYQTLDYQDSNVIDELEKDMNNIQNEVIDDLAAEISKSAYHESIMSVWAITSPTPKTETQAAKIVCTHTPKLCQEKDFQETMKSAFAEFQKKIKDKPLKTLNATGKEDVLKSDVLPIMKQMNSICSEYNSMMYKVNADKKAKEDYERMTTSAVDNTYVHNPIKIEYEANHRREEFDNKQNGLLAKLLPLYDEMLNSELGYLFITDRFKEDIGTFSVNDIARKCMGGVGDGKFFHPRTGAGDLVTMDDLKVADVQFKKLVTDELKKIDDEYGKIRALEEDELANFIGADNVAKGKMFEQYLKTNPLTIIKMLKENPNSDFAKALCSYILSIEDEDYRNRIRDWVLAGVGAVAGVALMFTGIGAPVGATLLALSIGATAAEVLIIIDEKNQHAQNAIYIEQAAATAQYELDIAIDDAVSEREASKGTINDVLWIVGPDVLGFGIGKIAKSIKFLKRGKSITKLTKLDDVAGGGGKVLNATDEVQEVVDGLKKMQRIAGESHLQTARHYQNLTNEEVLQLGAIFSRLDDAESLKLLNKLDEFENATEMKRFLSSVHSNIDDFIIAGKVDVIKLVNQVDSTKMRKLASFDKIIKESDEITNNVIQSKKVNKGLPLDKKEVLFVKKGELNKVKNLKVVETEPGMYDVVGDLYVDGVKVKSYSFGGVTAPVNDGVLEMSALIKRTGRGNGFQNDLFEHVVKNNPNIKVIKSDKLIGSNQTAFTESMIQKYQKANGLEVKSYKGLSVEEIGAEFDKCCSQWADDLAKNNPKEYKKMLMNSLEDTPAFKSRANLGFSQVDEGVLSINRNNGGAYNIDNFFVRKPIKNFTVVKGNSTSFKTSGIEEQVDYITKEIPGLSRNQARVLIEGAHSRSSSVVFGGSRVRGDFKTGSDLDVGFGGINKTQASKIIKKAGKVEDGLPIEQTKIVPGNETNSIPKIESPEEFFMRKGTRGPNDLKAGEEYIPSGYITIKPDGTIIKTIPVE